MNLTYGTVCSGIEAPSSAVDPLGWTPLWFSEIEPFPKAVLAHHYPTVPDLGDMTAIPARVLAREVPTPDVFIGGTPCQSFSVAGLRKGLADPRGQLTRTFVEILDALDHVRALDGKPPAICLYENVPGILSDKENAFGNFLAALVGEDEPLQPAGPRWTDAGCVLGPTRTAAWRVLDAQYFGVAQRRRRVFVVVCARGAGVDPVEVLLVEEGVRRDPPTRGEAREDASADPRSGAASGGHHPELPSVVGTLSDGAHNGGGLNGQDAYTGRILPVHVGAVPGTPGGGVVPPAPGREGGGLGHEAGACDPGRGFL
jgi:DNA (cytosine-5)-methyltransferase 1